MNLGISRYSVASLLLLYLGGCAATPKQVVSAARKDLSCPGAEVSEIGEDRYGASGCGRGAVYARVCDDQGCRWGRLRHGHEIEVAAQSAPVLAPAEAREILPAPAPESREVLPAPAPAQREILPAPLPNAEGAAPGEKPEAAPDATAPSSSPATGVAPAPVPLSQGELSAPYDATVPERPEAQRSAYAPPQPLVDDRPPPPAPYYAWVGGYWWWGAGGWVWLPGYWSQPYANCNYYPGYWYWSMNYWWYWPGGWARPGSTTIVYRTAPRPERVVRVRSFTPRTTSGAGVVSRTPATRSVGRASAVSGFRPSSSPLLRYPTQVRASPQGSRVARSTDVGAARSGSGVGQIVRPGTLSPRPTSFTTSRAVRPSAAATRAVTPSGSSSPAIRHSAPRPSGARFSAPRSPAPARMPSVGRPQRR